jgi:hypothetical protein
VQISGYNEQPPELALRQPMDAGPPKVRKLYSAGVETIPCEQLLTSAQKAILKAFYAAHPGMPFDWVHPATKEAATIRIGQVPTYKPEGQIYWRAFLKLEIMP